MDDYILDDNGNRVMSPEYIRKQEVEYLKAKKLDIKKANEKTRLKYANILMKAVSWYDPAIIMYDKDISRDIYAAIIALLNRKLDRFLSYDVTTVSHLCQQYLSGEYHDISDEFDHAQVLFVDMNMSDVPHMYRAYCARNIAEARKAKGKLTYLFFRGKSEDLLSDTWSIDEEGLGNRGLNWDSEKHEMIDFRRLHRLNKYIKVVDLNERLR